MGGDGRVGHGGNDRHHHGRTPRLLHQGEALHPHPQSGEPDALDPDVVNGSDDLGVAHGAQVTIAQEKGVPIVVVGSLVPEPTAALIWSKESDIGGIADLKGKTIAIPGLSFQRDFLETILARGGLTLDDVKVKSVGNELVPALASGKADAIFGGSGNQEGPTSNPGGSIRWSRRSAALEYPPTKNSC